MKLCPECDFIYEDDQAICDMDGKQLVPQPQPVSVSAPVASAPDVAGHGSKRWVALAAGLALLLAVIAVAYVSQASQKRSYSASSSMPSVAVETTPQPDSVPAATPAAIDSSESNNANASAREVSTKMLTNAAAATAANAGASANDSGHVILRLTNGATISADDAWPGKNGVWYRQGGLVTFLKGNQLKAIERIPARRTNTPTNEKAGKAKIQTAAAPNSLRLKRLEPATPQKPSRMTSFLRKTGDFFKKPFKR